MSESITNDLNRVMDSTGRLNASYNDLDKPQKRTVDILSDDLPTPSAPNSIDADFAQ